MSRKATRQVLGEGSNQPRNFGGHLVSPINAQRSYVKTKTKPPVTSCSTSNNVIKSDTTENFGITGQTGRKNEARDGPPMIHPEKRKGRRSPPPPPRPPPVPASPAPPAEAIPNVLKPAASAAASNAKQCTAGKNRTDTRKLRSVDGDGEAASKLISECKAMNGHYFSVCISLREEEGNPQNKHDNRFLSEAGVWFQFINSVFAIFDSDFEQEVKTDADVDNNTGESVYVSMDGLNATPRDTYGTLPIEPEKTDREPSDASGCRSVRNSEKPEENPVVSLECRSSIVADKVPAEKDSNVIANSKAQSLVTYVIPLKLTSSAGGCNKYTVSFNHNRQIVAASVEKTIVLIGSNKAAKDMVIGSLVNYIYDVQRVDSFRFVLVNNDQASIKTYTIPQCIGSRVKFTLTIVDLPGFGGADGIAGDREIEAKFRAFFGSEIGLKYASLIAFVLPASNTDELEKIYAYEKALSLLSNDVRRESIVSIFTGVDEQLTAEAEKTAKFCVNDEYFTLNCSMLPSNRNLDAGEHQELILAEEATLGRLLSRLGNSPVRNLTLTRELMIENEKLAGFTNNLRPQLLAYHNKIGQLSCKAFELHRLRVQMVGTNRTTLSRADNRPSGTQAPREYCSVFCDECKTICHFDCECAAGDSGDVNCLVFDRSDEPKCTACAGKCGWKSHVKQRSEGSPESYGVTMRKRFNANAVKVISALQEEVNSLGEECKAEVKKICWQILNAKNILARQEQRALKAFDQQRFIEYLDSLIAREAQLAQPETSRSKAIAEAKQRAQLLMELRKCNGLDQLIKAILH